MNNRRDLLVMIRVNEDEQRRLKRQAQREPLATWARRILLAHVDRKERRAGK